MIKMKTIQYQFHGVNLSIEYFLLVDGETPCIVTISIKNEDVTELVGYDNKQAIITGLKKHLKLNLVIQK